MKKFEKIVDLIARQSGSTPEEVLQEMQQAIDYAAEHHDKNGQRLWNMMNFKSGKPTPEEFIMQMAMMLNRTDGPMQ